MFSQCVGLVSDVGHVIDLLFIMFYYLQIWIYEIVFLEISAELPFQYERLLVAE